MKKKLMKDTIIFFFPNFKSLISVIYGNLKSNCNFFFQLIQQVYLSSFAYLISHDTKLVISSNNFFNNILIPIKYRLYTITKILYKKFFCAVFNLKIVEILAKLTLKQFNCHAVIISLVNLLLETKFHNVILIYGDKQTIQRVAALVAKFLTS